MMNSELNKQEPTKNGNGKRIYISGPISSLPLKKAQENFDNAEQKLTNKGYHAVNPMRDNPVGWTWLEYMARDVCMMADCEAIYMLKGWEDSAGARIEFLLATKAEFEIYYEQ